MAPFNASEASLGRLYDAAVSPELWPQVLQELARDANAVGCCITVDNVKETLITPAMSPELAEPLADFVNSGWYKHDLRGRLGWPLIRAGRRVLIEHDVCTEDDRRHGAYHNEWLRPWDLPWWATVGFPSGHSHYGLALFRNSRQGPFTPAEAAKLDAWRPHLMRAISLAQMLAHSRAETVLATLQYLGRAAFVLDTGGLVSQMNASADVLLGRELEICQGKLRALSRRDDAALQRFLAAVIAPPFPSDAAKEEPVSISREQGGHLLIEALPTLGLLQDLFAGTRALLLVTELDVRAAPPESKLREIFGLTAAQAAVTARLAAGSDVREIADSLEIATGTVRNHLKAAFMKTGTHRQSELMALVQRIRSG